MGHHRKGQYFHQIQVVNKLNRDIANSLTKIILAAKEANDELVRYSQGRGGHPRVIPKIHRSMVNVAITGPEGLLISG